MVNSSPVNSSPVNSSHTRLSTQSTRHKPAHNKTTSTSRNYLHVVRRHPETVLNTDGVITAIYVTLIILYITDHGDRLHFYEKHGQLVTMPWNATVNSSHDFTMWRVDRVTCWLVTTAYTREIACCRSLWRAQGIKNLNLHFYQKNK